jgi:ribonuclease BN (tRNA processing enzyme)
MRVEVVAAGPVGFPLSTCLIDDALAVDAGALGWCGPPARLARVRDILLTHPHIDHLAGLPVFLDAVYDVGPAPPRVHAPRPTLDALQAHVFNGVLMPDFVAMSRDLPPFLTLHPVQPGLPFVVGPYTVTAVVLDHTVPTVGYVLDDGRTAVAILTDTAPVPAAVALLAGWPRLRAVFLEASFPDHLADLAAVSKHLTTSQFLAHARQLPAGVAVYAVHLKPRWADEIAAGIRAAGHPNVRAAVPGEVFDIG